MSEKPSRRLQALKCTIVNQLRKNIYLCVIFGNIFGVIKTLKKNSGCDVLCPKQWKLLNHPHSSMSP